MSQTPAMKQHTFAGGEISQELTARTDLERYAQSLSTCENWIITPTGVAKNRPGTKFIGEVKDSTKKTRLLPFIFNQDQQYIIEVGDGYMRFYRDGGLLMQKIVLTGVNEVLDATGQNMTDASDHDPWVDDFWIGAKIENTTTVEESVVNDNTATVMVCLPLLASGWNVNDEYRITQHEGTHTAGDDQAVLTDSTKDWDTDSLKDGWVYNVDDGSSARIESHTATTITAQLQGGLKNLWDTGDEYYIEIPVEVTSPWLEEDLPYLRIAQQNDLMYIVCRGYLPYELKRYGDTDWRLSIFDTTRPVEPPTGLAIDTTDSYVMTIANTPSPPVQEPKGEEWDWVVTTVDANGVESLPSDVHTEQRAVFSGSKNISGTFSFEGIPFTWTPPAAGNAPDYYNVYRGLNGIYGYVGQVKTPPFVDLGNVPDYSDAPPGDKNPFIDPQPASQKGDLRIAEDDHTGSSPWTAEKFFTPESYNKRYNYTQNIVLWPGQTVDVTFKYDSGTGDVTLETIRCVYDPIVGGAYQNCPISRNYEIDGMDLGDDFKSSIALIVGSPPLIGEKLTVTWYEDLGLPETVDTYPNSICFFEQRLLFGGFSQNAGQIKASRTGDYYNYDRSQPLKDDDGLDLTLASLKNDAIIDVIPLEKLFVLTAGSEWVVQGADGGPLTPTSFDAKARTFYGSANVQGLPIGNALLFIGERSRKVREFNYDGVTQTGRVRDLTIMVEHLFRQYSIVEWGYADVPYQIVWAIRSDGTLLGMTYVQEHNMWAWHRHVTGPLDTRTGREGNVRYGKFEALAIIHEGDESKLYTVVQRTVDGSTKRYIEVFAPRQFEDTEDWIFMDSTLTYDGRNTGATQLKLEPLNGTHTGADNSTVELEDTAHPGTWVLDEFAGREIKNTTNNAVGTITGNDEITDKIYFSGGLTGGAGGENDFDQTDGWEITPLWQASEKMTLVSDTAGTFDDSMVGQEFELTGINATTENDEVLRVRVYAYEDDQNLLVWALTAVPTSLQRTYTATWARCPKTFTGLDHLEGEEVALLVDGATHENQTVSSGSISLDTNIYAARLQVGLPYKSDLMTLPLHAAGDQGSIRDAKKSIQHVGVELDNWRGLWIGHDLDNLREIEQRQVEINYETINPDHDFVVVRPRNTWSRTVNVALRQIDPLPVSALAVIVAADVGGNQ